MIESTGKSPRVRGREKVMKVNEKIVDQRNKQRKSRSVDSVRIKFEGEGSEKEQTIDDVMTDKEKKGNFYKFLVETYSNEFFDFYEEVVKYQKTLFEDESERKSTIEEISKKYLGIGEGAEYLISFNFEVMDEFKENLANHNFNNIFSVLLEESKGVLNGLYHNYIAQ